MVALLSLCALLVASGCFRYQTRVPGVVDLRSDASEAPRAAPPAPTDEELVRPEGLALVMGAGVRAEGSRVTVEDRHGFVRGLIPLWNTSAEEELSAALALGGGLAEVELGEEYGVIDVVLTLAASFIPVVSWLAPTSHTFVASGEVIDLGLAGAPSRTLPADPFDDLPPPPAFEEER